MITLEYKGVSETLQQEWLQILRDNTDVLERAQAGEQKYTDSLGWLDTDEWADEAYVRRIEEIAAEVRANASAFVLIGV